MHKPLFLIICQGATLLKTFDCIMNLEFIKFFSFLSAKGLFTMIDHVKAKLKEAKLRLTKGDNSSAFRLAFEALDIFLRELCFKCGAPLESRPEKRSVSKWGFTKCVDFLRSTRSLQRDKEVFCSRSIIYELSLCIMVKILMRKRQRAPLEKSSVSYRVEVYVRLL